MARKRKQGHSALPRCRAAALEWLRLQQKGWKPRHHAAVKRSLERDIFPEIGSLQLTSIRPADIRPMIDAVQHRGAVDTAHRLLWRIKSVFDLAIATGEAEMNPAASIQAILQPQVIGRFPAILEVEQARVPARLRSPARPARNQAGVAAACTHRIPAGPTSARPGFGISGSGRCGALQANSRREDEA
ncbi:tyrosine-type recombinase/integrase [Novosphingobium beihaiensis]|uniref:tyrosine-type recombinase/integrase n=1 Tax=Novosphingobium beihaiensis TaxID=2930389 RepID=UPI00389950AD